MSLYVELLQATRAEIVNLLKRQGTMSVETLATELDISKVAVRRHLDQLEDQGFIDHSSERCERGRPKFIYSLTNEGDGLFPDRSADFACDLLSQVGQRYGADAVDALLVDQADANIESLRRDVDGLDFDSRVHAVVKQFNERGYVADIERLEDGSFRIVEHNCPIRDVADRYPQVCREELRVYSEVTGGSVLKTCCMIANGARSCEYRILPADLSSALAQPTELSERPEKAVDRTQSNRALPVVSTSRQSVSERAPSTSSGAPVLPGSSTGRSHSESPRVSEREVRLAHEVHSALEGPIASISASSEPDSKPVSSTGSDQTSGGDSSFRGHSRKVCMTVCVNVHCSMNGADELVEHLVAQYGVAPDVPSETGLSVELTYCFGACDLGPNVEIDGQFSEGVTVEKLDELLSRLQLDKT